MNILLKYIKEKKVIIITAPDITTLNLVYLYRLTRLPTGEECGSSS